MVRYLLYLLMFFSSGRTGQLGFQQVPESEVASVRRGGQDVIRRHRQADGHDPFRRRGQPQGQQRRRRTAAGHHQRFVEFILHRMDSNFPLLEESCDRQKIYDLIIYVILNSAYNSRGEGGGVSNKSKAL